MDTIKQNGNHHEEESGQDAFLQNAYGVIAELWCSPQDVDMTEVRSNAEEVIEGLMGVDEEASMMFARFLSSDPITESKYIDMFELEPKCSLYLGSHSFDEPKSCAGAGVSDRNKYMIDLRGIYGHFKQAINGTELPDYLPLMVDFLSLTADKRSDEIRNKFISEYLLPYLPPVRRHLEELKTPYLHLFDALERIIKLDSPSAAIPKEKKTSAGKFAEQKIPVA